MATLTCSPAAGFLVYKSVPVGTVGEVLPYLSRRAAENRAVMRGARRERQLLAKELAARVTRRG
ncbi:Proline dehydrogenase 1, mitochondrial [Portunus trituberculatus]|uniref:Proline dehydrogenase n=1 Tax=Portunus trituberculatus TaxID=210409 RepID=A0A5B7HPH1_PORTR|nr:Proline dehydrogenase 1, mitochondrial [Portunus trituberculatus]